MGIKKKHVIIWMIYLGMAAGIWITRSVLAAAGIELREWLDILLSAAAVLFPVIMIGWHISRIPQRTVAIVFTVLYFAAAFLALTVLTFVKLFHMPQEYDLGAGIICLGEQHFPDETTYTYWDKVSFFGRQSFTWDESHDIRLLNEKYGTQFHQVKGEEGKSYASKQYPELAIKIRKYPVTDMSQMEDEYPQKIAESLFLKTYEEEKRKTAYTATEESDFVLICPGKSSIDRTAEEAARMISRALEEPIFKKYTAYLGVQMEIGGKSEIIQLSFYDREEISEDSFSYKNPENVKEALEDFYQKLEEKYTEEFLEEKKDSGYSSEAYISEAEQAYDRLYDLEFSEKYGMNEKQYNAKGNFYAVLEEGTEEYKGQKEVPYDITVVYDRVSDDGVSQLFVQYKNHYLLGENGETKTETEILTGYSINMVTGETETYEVNW